MMDGWFDFVECDWHAVIGAEALERIGRKRQLEVGFGDAGGSSQHDFNATIEYDGGSGVMVIAMSNRSAVVAEDIGVALLNAAAREAGGD